MKFIELVSRITLFNKKGWNRIYNQCSLNYNIQFRDNDQLIELIKILLEV